MIRNTLGDIQDSYRHFITPWRFLVRHLVRVIGQKKLKKYDNPVNMDWVCGAFMMMSRASYTFAKGLDDGYFLYSAEIEYEGTRSARYSLKYALVFLKSLLRYWRKFGCIG